MRTFYVFLIDKFFLSIYGNKANTVYDYLKKISNPKNKSIKDTLALYKLCCAKYNKNELELYIRNCFSESNNYFIKQEINYYQDNMTNEYSSLEIKKSFLRIKTNKNNPLFFQKISDFQDNLFICDFQSNDYFWISQIYEESLV